MSDIESMMSFGGGVLHSTANQPQNNSVLLSENNLLKESLQKEKYRRKVRVLQRQFALKQDDYKLTVPHFCFAKYKSYCNASCSKALTLIK